jgi:L-lactate utilization protein LutB
MNRQKYQEKYIKRNEEIKSLEEDVKDVFYLFEEIKEINEKFGTSVQQLSDLIEDTKKEVVKSEVEVIKAKEEDDSNTYIRSVVSGVVGAGLGSLLFVYSPLIGIGTTVGGFIGGYSIPYFLK